jgi:hypothetical protein
MGNNYKGQNIAEMLENIAAMETRLRLISADTDPFSLAQFEELSHGYATLAITKARLTALQEERKQ